MAFGFGSQAVTPLDQVSYGPALNGVGSPLDTLPQAAPAPAPPPDPQQPPMPAQANGQPYQPSKFDIAMDMLFNGHTPGDAAQHVRARDYGVWEQAMMRQALENAAPAQRQAMLLNPGEYGKALAQNFGPINTPAGTTQTMLGGPGNGGYAFMAPQFIKDDTSGDYGVQTQAGYVPQGRFGGGYKAEAGLIYSPRDGSVANTYSTPQIVAPGSAPGQFTPTVSGAPGQPAPVQASGQPPMLPPPSMSLGDAVKALQAIAPGAVVTSGFRTPAKNAAVGGVPNSMHTRGDGGALDFQLPQGTTFDQFKAGLTRQGLPASELINEGDHIHWAFAPKGPPVASAQPAPGGGWNVGAPVSETHVLPPDHPLYSRYAPGTVLSQEPGGKITADTTNAFTPERQMAYASSFMGTPQYQDYTNLRRFHDAAQLALTQEGGPADLQILDMALKSNNPTLGIRPNQVDQMMEELGLPNRYKGELTALVQNGQKLSPEARQAMVNVIDNQMNASWKTLQPLLTKADRDAARFGLKRDDLIPSIIEPAASAPASSGFGAAKPQLPQTPPGTPDRAAVAAEMRRRGLIH